MDDLERARQLRMEAAALEEKDRVRKRLLQLIEISQDPYYDQYLEQMKRDLESGKASPGQVFREAERTFQLYQQRVREGKVAIQKTAAPVSVMPSAAEAESVSSTQSAAEADSVTAMQSAAEADSVTAMQPAAGSISDTKAAAMPFAPQPRKQEKSFSKDLEFKIGAGIFSVVGAVFILTAFVIIGFNFLQGIWQGIALYAASLIVILFSELLIKRLSEKFSQVITAIGISALYISTVVNFGVLHNFNAIVAAVLALLIAAVTIFISWKKDAASIRLISIIGYYICFLPMNAGGEYTELNFLIMTGILLLVNLVSIFLPNQSNANLISLVHLAAHICFTGILLLMVLYWKLDAKYLAFFLIVSLIITELVYFRQKDSGAESLLIVSSVALGINLIYIAVAAYFGTPKEAPDFYFNKYLAECLAFVVLCIFFFLWGNERRKWIQCYAAAALIALFHLPVGKELEMTIAALAVLLLIKLFYKEKLLAVLEDIWLVLTIITAWSVGASWYLLPLAIGLLLSAVFIKRHGLFQEFVLAVGLLRLPLFFEGDWTLPASMALVFGLFLLFNHLPWMKNIPKLPFNIFSLAAMLGYSLFAVLLSEYYYNIAAMVIGSVFIITVLRERYRLAFKEKYLILSLYLTYMILTAHFSYPFLVSILLMAVAVLSIICGFLFKDKIYRIYGLVMALLICVKIVLRDFISLESAYRAILFFGTGIFALAISFIYILLEKKEHDRAELNHAQPKEDTNEV